MWWIWHALIRAPIPPKPSPHRYSTAPWRSIGLPIHGLPVAMASAMSRAMNDLNEPGGPYKAAKALTGNTPWISHSTGSSCMSSHDSMLTVLTGLASLAGFASACVAGSGANSLAMSSGCACCCGGVASIGASSFSATSLSGIVTSVDVSLYVAFTSSIRSSLVLPSSWMNS